VNPRALQLNDPALVAANEQGLLTPEQLAMLANRKYTPAGGCVALMFGIILALCISATLITEAVQGQFNPAYLSAYLSAYAFPLILCLPGWLVISVRMAARKRFIKRVIDGGYFFPIERAQGEVAWNGRRYVPRTPAGVLRITGQNIPPGPYHFYYAREQMLALSVRPIHTDTQVLALPGTLAATGLPGDEQARLAIQHALCDTLAFTLSDLDTNRQGFVTRKQARKLPRKLRRSTSPIVQTLTGEIRFFSENHSSPEKDYEDYVYYFEISRVRFEVPAAATRALVSGIPYRVYYVLPGQLLSVEPLTAPAR
jgi:hypothetical protein